MNKLIKYQHKQKVRNGYKWKKKKNVNVFIFTHTHTKKKVLKSVITKDNANHD